MPERQWHLPVDFILLATVEDYAKALRSLSRSEIISYLTSHGETVLGRLLRLFGAGHVGPSPYHREGLPVKFGGDQSRRMGGR